MRRAASWLIVFFGFVYPVNAAPGGPAITLRSGTVSIPYPGARPRVIGGGPGIDFSGFFDSGAFMAEQCRPCLGGSMISLRGLLSGTALGQQYIIANDFTFNAADVQVPQDGSSAATLSAPFTFEGSIALAQVREPKPDETTLTAELSGAGTATLHLSSTVDPETGRRLYFFQDLTYEFTASPGH